MADDVETYGERNYSRRNSNRNRYNNRRNRQQNQRSEAHSPKEPEIVQYKLDTYICPRCQQPINDLPAALAEKETGAPVHFDCVLKHLSETVPVKENEKITYIGQGRFAVVYFDNPHDLRHFSIQRIIEWEERDKNYEWRSTVSNLYSSIK